MDTTSRVVQETAAPGRYAERRPEWTAQGTAPAANDGALAGGRP
jgi:hypothetical protein